MTLVPLLAGISWEPQIRGILMVGVGVAVLMGSVYLLLGTNLGNRLGFMVALTGLFGWVMLHSLVFVIYPPATGPRGRNPAWEVQEVNFQLDQANLDEARRLRTDALPPVDKLGELESSEFTRVAASLKDDLGGWTLIPESDPTFGEARAAAEESLVKTGLPGLGVSSADDLIVTYAFEEGGKDPLGPDPSRWDRIWHKIKSTAHLTHPPHYSIVQFNVTVPQETVPGEAPPAPRPDTSKPTISVIMERDLGQVRLPATLSFLGSGLVFATLCNLLHRRDRRVAAARALVPTAAD